MKKIGLFALAGALTLGGLGASHAFANENGGLFQRGQNQNQVMNKDSFVEKWSQLSDEEKETRIFERAAELGIDTDGKTVDEVIDSINEQRQQRLFDRAEEQGIDTEGKTADEVKELLKDQAPSGERSGKAHGKRMNKEQFAEKWNTLTDEEKEAKILERASELDIDTTGKKTEEIVDLLLEQRQDRLYDRAEKHGIDTEGKTLEEVKELLKEDILNSINSNSDSL
ncbi:hypothetical protein [Cytobacillus sp. IB215316]|uniref:hypothetical protein n=1 Tax=Cytobacillus sp. IB215316 TaxID=3097354 RepID=UPI002A12910B|nr:hypothetical protein [Cytobacillus sp. IB215316]MDX8362797.1 hypothetical protein [Cytobacillus sp. IB215316]